MLKTDKLIIRACEQTDLETLRRWWNSVEACGDYQVVGFTSQANLEERFKKEGFNGQDLKLLIVELESSPIGLLRISFTTTGTPGVRVASLGLSICEPEHRGAGFGSEITIAIVDYLFSNYNMQRIDAETDVENQSGRRVLDKCGFSREGVLRQYRFYHGRYRDYVIYSILRPEWEAAKA